jgi:YhcH/YjgK/YiaL family protein
MFRDSALGNPWFRFLRGCRAPREFARMALFGLLSTLRGQITRPEHFAAAFAFVEDAGRAGSAAYRQLFGLSAGQTERTELPGGAFALSQVYLTKPRSEGKWETHRAYIDVQAVFAGEEFMEVTDRGRLTVAEDLTATRDAIFYQPFDRGSVVRLGAGDVAVYFQVDAHLGGIAVAAPMLVRKVVVKVPVLAA